MKPFHFPLETVLILRQQQERTAKQHYATTLAACKKAELQVGKAAGELATVWDTVAQELRQGLTASRLGELQRWCLVVETRWHECQAVLDEARKIAERAFQEMTAAVRACEALDRFREKSRHAHDRARVAGEQKELDELAVQLSSTPGLLQTAGHNI